MSCSGASMNASGASLFTKRPTSRGGGSITGKIGAGSSNKAGRRSQKFSNKRRTKPPSANITDSVSSVATLLQHTTMFPSKQLRPTSSATTTITTTRQQQPVYSAPLPRCCLRQALRQSPSAVARLLCERRLARPPRRPSVTRQRTLQLATHSSKPCTNASQPAACAARALQVWAEQAVLEPAHLESAEQARGFCVTTSASSNRQCFNLTNCTIPQVVSRQYQAMDGV